jgi:acyl-CoA thioester hydrolase
MQGIVFYGHYLAYFDVAITELYREAIGSWGMLADHGADLVVAEAGIRYRASARFDDEIDLIASIRQLGATSVVTDLSIERVGDGALLVEGELRHVFVDRQSLAKRDIPVPVRSQLERYLAAPGAVGR